MFEDFFRSENKIVQLKIENKEIGNEFTQHLNSFIHISIRKTGN